MYSRHVAEKFSERRTRGVFDVSGRTRTWFSFVIQRQSRRILITFLPRSCLSWERTRNLCRMIALRSAHSLPKNFRTLLSMETLRWSRCSRSGPFGKRQQFFMRNTTARRRKPLPDRYSRHYYDVAMLAQGPIRADALADKDLLAQVVRHKETFYPSAWARYDLARPGSFQLHAGGEPHCGHWKGTTGI